MTKFILRAEHIYKRFDDLEVLKDISLQLQRQEIIGIVGPSGVGKSTLLRILSCLERQNQGKVFLCDKKLNSPTPKIMLVQQNFDQLLPWKTVVDNVAYPAIATKLLDEDAAKKEALDLIKEVGLSGFENYFPRQLSGGMQQRTAIARALIMKPEVLLLDEPFSALDDAMRLTMRKLIKSACDKYKLGVIFASHNTNDILNLSNTIIDLKRRQVIRCST